MRARTATASAAATALGIAVLTACASTTTDDLATGTSRPAATTSTSRANLEPANAADAGFAATLVRLGTQNLALAHLVEGRADHPELATLVPTIRHHASDIEHMQDWLTRWAGTGASGTPGAPGVPTPVLQAMATLHGAEFDDSWLEHMGANYAQAITPAGTNSRTASTRRRGGWRASGWTECMTTSAGCRAGTPRGCMTTASRSPRPFPLGPDRPAAPACRIVRTRATCRTPPRRRTTRSPRTIRSRRPSHSPATTRSRRTTRKRPVPATRRTVTTTTCPARTGRAAAPTGPGDGPESPRAKGLRVGVRGVRVVPSCRFAFRSCSPLPILESAGPDRMVRAQPHH